VKLSRLLSSLVLAVLGLLLTLYGLFALAFREGDGSTYVMIRGHRADARFVGVINLVIGVAAILCAGIFVRRSQLRD
jgi:uncharacterized membrane protein